MGLAAQPKSAARQLPVTPSLPSLSFSCHLMNPPLPPPLLSVPLTSKQSIFYDLSRVVWNLGQISVAGWLAVTHCRLYEPPCLSRGWGCDIVKLDWRDNIPHGSRHAPLTSPPETRATRAGRQCVLTMSDWVGVTHVSQHLSISNIGRNKKWGNGEDFRCEQIYVFQAVTVLWWKLDPRLTVKAKWQSLPNSDFKPAKEREKKKPTHQACYLQRALELFVIEVSGDLSSEAGQQIGAAVTLLTVDTRSTLHHILTFSPSFLFLVICYLSFSLSPYLSAYLWLCHVTFPDISNAHQDDQVSLCDTKSSSFLIVHLSHVFARILLETMPRHEKWCIGQEHHSITSGWLSVFNPVNHTTSKSSSSSCRCYSPSFFLQVALHSFFMADVKVF